MCVKPLGAVVNGKSLGNVISYPTSNEALID